MLNDTEDRQEFVAAAKELGLLSGEKKLVILVICKNTNAKPAVFSEDDYLLLNANLKKLLKERFQPESGEPAHVSAVMNSSLIILASLGSADSIIESLSSLCDALPIDYTIGIGNAFEQAEFLGISYREAHEAIIRCKPGQKINSYTKESSEVNAELRRLTEKNREIIQALESGGYDSISEIVEGLFSKLVGYEPYDAFNFCIDSIKHILEYFGLDELEKFKIKYRFDLMGPTNREIYNSIKATYMDNIIRITDIIKSMPGGLIEYGVKRAVEIISKDYSNPDLSLLDISQALNISYGYLSKVFKQKTGQSFVNYLTSVRISNAKKLLLENSLKIYEVAKAVGYRSSGYFITAFKNFTGTAPGDYKARITKN